MTADDTVKTEGSAPKKSVPVNGLFTIVTAAGSKTAGMRG
jgi:hypothetical protein